MCILQSLSAQAGTESSGQQPQGSQAQCWVGAGSLPRKWWGWGCWLCSSSDLQNPFSICSIKRAVVLCCAGWSSLVWQSGADVFSTFDNLLVPSRCTSWLLHFTFSCRHKWTAKWQRMGLFLLISTEFPLLPSSEKEIIATRFYENNCKLSPLKFEPVDVSSSFSNASGNAAVKKPWLVRIQTSLWYKIFATKMRNCIKYSQRMRMKCPPSYLWRWLEELWRNLDLIAIKY